MSDSFENFELSMVPGSVKGAMHGAKSSDLWKVPLSKLRVKEGFNVRVQNEAHAEQVRFIADSMKANGFFPDKPIAGYVSKENGESVIYVVDGHTRLQAVHLANSEGAEITELPVVTKPAGTSMEDLTVALVVSNGGRNLTPYEVALVCKRLIGFGMTETEIARRIGKSRNYVSDLLLLAGAPRSITNMVQDGTVSATLAVASFKKHGAQAAEVLEKGLEQATSSGKGKVTGKHLKKETTPPRTLAVIPGSGSAPAPQKSTDETLERGIRWINANDPQGEISVSLLSYLTCVSAEEIQSRLIPKKL